MSFSPHVFHILRSFGGRTSKNYLGRYYNVILLDRTFLISSQVGRITELYVFKDKCYIIVFLKEYIDTEYALWDHRIMKAEIYIFKFGSFIEIPK